MINNVSSKSTLYHSVQSQRLAISNKSIHGLAVTQPIYPLLMSTKLKQVDWHRIMCQTYAPAWICFTGWTSIAICQNQEFTANHSL